MDEERLGELFRTAAAAVEPPPASFGHEDVLAGSHRLARRQRALVTAAVVAVAGLGVGAVVGGGLGHTGPASALAEAPTQASGPESAPGAARDTDGARPDAGTGAAKRSGGAAVQAAPAPGAAPDAAAPRLAPTTAPLAAPPGAFNRDADPTTRGRAGFVVGCAKPDAEVFAQLIAVRSELRGRTPHPVPDGCAEGGVGVAVNANGGALAVVVTPAGVPDPKPSDSATRRSVVVLARSGRTLRLTATAPDGPPPDRDRLRTLAADLATRL